MVGVARVKNFRKNDMKWIQVPIVAAATGKHTW